MNPRDTQAEDLATKRPARGVLRAVGAAWERQVGEQVDCDLAWLVVLRIAAGLAGMVVPALYWLLPQRFDGFLQSQVQIPYAALPWIAPLPPFVMKALLGIAVLAGVCVLLGLYFRVAAITLFVVFAYHFLLDSSYYQSTAYLLVLLSLLLACSPAHHLWALDARRIAAEKRGQGGVLLLWIFRFQLALVYFYAGVAKIDADWVSGRTLSVMVPAARLDALSSRFLSSQGVSVAMSWIGLAFDLLVAPGLLWRRTRTFALVALVLFHLHNALTFRLVHLPWAMLFLSTVFLEPSWPRKLLRFVPQRQTPPASSLPQLRPSRWALLAALVYCTCQTAVPLRKWLYAGNAYFTECGFSVFLGDAESGKDCDHRATGHRQADRTEGAYSARERNAADAGWAGTRRSTCHLAAESAAVAACAEGGTEHCGVCTICGVPQRLCSHCVCCL